MKRLGFVLSFVISALGCQAQEFGDTEETDNTLYIRGGVSLAGLQGGEISKSSEHTLGYSAGMGYVQYIGRKQNTGLALEATFAQQGLRSKVAKASTDVEYIRLNYINVGAVVRYHPFESFRPLYLGVGPQVGFRVGGHVVTNDGSEHSLDESKVAEHDYSGIALLGFNFGRSIDWGLEFRYQNGFSKVLLDAPDARHSVVQATLIIPPDVFMMLAEAFSQ